MTTNGDLLPLLQIIEYLYAYGEGTLDDLVSGTNATRAEVSLAVADGEHIFTVTDKPDYDGLVRPYYELTYRDLAIISERERFKSAMKINRACRNGYESIVDTQQVSEMTDRPVSHVREVMTNHPDMFKFLGYLQGDKDNPLFTCNYYLPKEESL